jgi:hypothetical protein
MKRIACRAGRGAMARSARAPALRRAAAILAIGALGATASAPAHACGYHVAIGGVSVVHPTSIPVAVAIHAAVRDGRLALLADAPAPLALLRANGAMRTLATALQSATPDLPPVALVLVEAHLWGRAVPGAGPTSWQAHTDGPASGDVIVVTGEPALAALLDGRLRWDAAVASGLVVLDGPAEGRARVVGILARQFS